MNLFALATQVMLAHSDAWLHTPEICDALDADPLGHGVLCKLRIAHEDLAQRQHHRATIERLVAEYTRELRALDSVHNGALRAMYHYLTAVSWSCRDPAEARDILELRDTLFPDGLSVVNRSYLARAGAAVELQSRVTPEVRARLAAMPLKGGTLADLYDELIDAGEAMGRLAQKRTSVVASLSKQGSEAADVDLGVGRRLWAQTVTALRHNLGLMEIDDAIRERLLAPLERSVRDAGRSRRGGRADADQAPAEQAGGEQVTGAQAERERAGSPERAVGAEQAAPRDRAAPERPAATAWSATSPPAPASAWSADTSQQPRAARAPIERSAQRKIRTEATT